ncbi:MAG: class I SAM-dependent methyltransferase [Promethearchaeota archaeon]
MKNLMYDDLAIDYDRKRKKPWKDLYSFLNLLKSRNFNFKGICVDLGCGNGRNIPLFLNQESSVIGIDNSLEFLRIIKSNILNKKLDSQRVNLILADIRYIPLRLCVIDNMFAIASIHHVKYSKERMKVIKNVNITLKAGGYFLLTVWRKYQRKYRKHFIKERILRIFSFSYRKKFKEANLKEFGDILVPWKISNKNIEIKRFYHFFSKYELKSLLRDFKILLIKKFGGPNKKDNFFTLVKKI